MSTVTISELSRNLIPSYGGVNETINLRGTVVFELPVGGVHSPNITVDLAVVGDFWIGGFTQALPKRPVAASR